MYNKALLIDFRIPSRLIAIGILLIIFLNFFFLGGTTLHNNNILVDNGIVKEFFLQQFNLALENVIAAWYSSMLLLSVAIMAGICYIADRQRFQGQKDRFLSNGWLMLCCIFTILSFDEIGSFHELINEVNVGESTNAEKGTSLSLLHVLIAIVGLFMVVFFWVKFKRCIWALLFAVAGASLFISHPIQEVYEWHTMNSSSNPAEWHRPNIFVLLEEGSEIFGSLCFLTSFTIYSIFATNSPTKRLFMKGINLNISLATKDLFLFVALLICTKGLLMLSLKLAPVSFEVGDAGIPRNWFPSAIAFLGAFFCLFFYFDVKRKQLPAKTIFLCLALVFLGTSAYFGSNIYASGLLKEVGVLRAIHSIKFIINIFTGALIVYTIRNRFSSYGVGIWLLLSCVVLYFGEMEHASQLAYISFSSLLVSSLFIYLEVTSQIDDLSKTNSSLIRNA